MDKQVIKYKVFYGDNSIYQSITLDLEEWGNIPKDNVQVIILYENTLDSFNRNTRVILNGTDYYSYDGNQFYSSNSLEECEGTILYGRLILDEAYETVRQLALNDYEIREVEI